MTRDFLKQRIGILGLAVNNELLVHWLLRHGAERVTICDRNPQVRERHPDWEGRVVWRLGDAYLDHLSDFDLVFRTPGIPYLTPAIQQAKAAGVTITSQTKLFFELSPARIIGVTGTKGKGTTSTLIYEILRRHHEQTKLSGNIYLAGNIGKDPFEYLDHLTEDDWVVLELSSFQLQDLTKGPHIAVVLSITSDHLDHHASRDEYVAAKAQILRTQTTSDFAVLHADSETVAGLADSSPAQQWEFSREHSVARGGYIDWQASGAGQLVLRDAQSVDHQLGVTDKLQLRGRHNLENILAAIVASHLAGADDSAILSAVESFRGLAHRLEFLGEVQGRMFYNDSFATGPDPVLAALRSFSEPVHLIVGGASKGADYSELADFIVRQSTVQTLIPLGDQEAIRLRDSAALVQLPKDKLTLLSPVFSMNDAVRAAYEASEPGDVILLSPGAASFDLFTDYKARGEAFRDAFRALQDGESR